MSTYKKPIVVAEIGCNHKGDLDIAKEMIRSAKTFCNADVVKFQKRHPMELLSPEEYRAPHPNPANSYGETYGAHREFLEFKKEEHEELQRYCGHMGIEYSVSVWDMTSAKEMTGLAPKMLKIPSACNLAFDLLDYIANNFGGDIHISFGMTTREEESRIVDFLESADRARDTVIYACTSGYPVPFEDVALLEIRRLDETYGKKVKGIGFSGHHLGIAVDIAAYTLGATYVERHFTLNRAWKGTDHAASLEPDGLRRLVRDLNASHEALRAKEKEILEIEATQRERLKRI